MLKPINIKVMCFLTALAGGWMVMPVLAADDSTSRSTGEFMTDSKLVAKVKMNLIKNNKTSANRITVNAYKGKVQLSGFVESEDEAKAAVKSAQSVEDVQEIVNSLCVMSNGCYPSETVQPTKGENHDDSDQMDNHSKHRSHADKKSTIGQYLSDSAITSKVKMALAGNKDTSAFNINVTTEKGVVRLQGTANTKDEKEEAQRTAEDVDGVKSVINDITVESDGSGSEQGK